MLKRHAWVIWFALTLGCPESRQAVAQTVGNEAPKPQVQADPVQAFLTQVRSRLGFTGKFVPVHATGTLHDEINGSDNRFDLWVVSPTTYRLDVDDTTPFTYAIDSERGYTVAEGKKKPLSYNESFGNRCPYLPIYSHLADAGKTASLAPDQAKNVSNVALSFRSVDADMPESAPYFDSYVEFEKTTALPVRLQTRIVNAKSVQMGATAEYLYSGYAQEGPYLLPHTVLVRMNGSPYLTFTYQSFQFSPAIPANFFAR